MPRFMDGHVRANRQKPSTIAAKEMIFRRHMPVAKHSTSFHDVEAFERLVDASGDDTQTRLIVLMGGEAGLRCGEMIALEWSDVDLLKRQLCVQRSDWNGQVRSPNGGRLRYIPLTIRLMTALREHRHLRNKRVPCGDDGAPLTRQKVQYRVKRAAQRAHVPEGVHLLPHTFCSHLAMRGAPVRAIQKLAGHSDLAMTQRYMHLSPAALHDAIRLLDGPSLEKNRGDILETGEKQG